VEYSPDRWMMRPRDVAKLLHTLRPHAGERALAICAPYAAAVLARMGLSVIAIEDASADAHARSGLEGEGVQVSAADLGQVEGEYDVIVCEGAVSAIPPSWLAALSPRGRLATVVRGGPAGKAVIYTKAGEAFGAREAFDSTPPYLPGFAPRAVFAF